MSYKIEEVKVEDKEKGVMWAVLLCILAVVLIVFGYYADKEEKLAMHKSGVETTDRTSSVIKDESSIFQSPGTKIVIRNV